jgi:hypothetical protein
VVLEKEAKEIIEIVKVGVMEIIGMSVFLSV